MSLIQTRLEECIQEFLKHCEKTKSWRIHRDQNLVQTASGFHKLTLVENPQLRFFRDAVKNPTTLIQDGPDYRTVRNTFTALISFEPVSAAVVLLFEENPTLSTQIAFYDLGSASKHPSTFSKINLTMSEVFVEFEEFLSEKYGLKLLTFSVHTNPERQNSPLSSKRSLLQRLWHLYSPTVFSNRKIMSSDKNLRQIPPSDVTRICYNSENGCCICIATASARLRPILT